MTPDKMVKAGLSLVDGKHVQKPNLVLVPAGAKTFPVTVEWSMQSDVGYVIGSDHADVAHRWCVLDAELKQVMHGAVKGGRKGPKKAEAVVSRTLHGGGADNPRQVTFDFDAGKLKNGAAYTLVASRHGLIAAGGFVAIRHPKPKAAAKKKAAGKPRKAAGKKKAVKAKKPAA
jgi:hypothetical protein